MGEVHHTPGVPTNVDLLHRDMHVRDTCDSGVFRSDFGSHLDEEVGKQVSSAPNPRLSSSCCLAITR